MGWAHMCTAHSQYERAGYSALGSPGRRSGDMKAEKAEVSLLRRGDRSPL